MEVDYVIKNPKNVYIRLNKNGAAITCTDGDKAVFEYSKAMNILDSLPKTLKRLNFKVMPISEISIEKDMVAKKKTIQSTNYVIPDTIQNWVEKFGICDDILKEARQRKEELYKLLSDVDKEFTNIVHEIEFEDAVDLYSGWKERNRVKENREKRRKIKDELLVLSSVVKMDFRNIDRETIEKVVAGLAKRKFTYRIIEDNEEEATENAV